MPGSSASRLTAQPPIESLYWCWWRMADMAEPLRLRPRPTLSTRRLNLESFNNEPSTMNLFSGIEKSIERGFQRWTERLFGAADSSELMLTHRAILEEIETKIETLARGRRVFPFSHLTVTLISADANRRAILETAFGERLEADIREALQSAACEAPRTFSIEVRAVETGPNPFEIEYAVAPLSTAATVPAASTAPARLAVIKGKTDHAEYTLNKA